MTEPISSYLEAAGGEIEFQDLASGALYTRPIEWLHHLHARGRMMGIIEADGRKAPQTDEDRARLLRTMVAYSGLYRLEGDKWVTELMSREPRMDRDGQVRFYKLEGDR